MKLVVTIPALNEERTVGQVVRGVPRQLDGFDEVQVVVVDDGSTDRTCQEAREAGAIVISHGRRRGLGSVFRAEMETAIGMGADIIVNIDGDGQFDPGDIPRLIEPILTGEADFVTCSRFTDPSFKRRMPRLKYFGNQMVTAIVNLLCGSRFTDVSCGFRAFSQEAACRMTLFGRLTHTQETFIDLASKGLRIAEVPLPVRAVRKHGRSRVASNILKYGIHSGWIILRVMRDHYPFQFFGAIALVLTLLAGGMGGFMCYWYFSHGGTSPFRSLIPVTGVLITLAFLMMILALLAEMLSRNRRLSEEIVYLARKQAAALGRIRAQRAGREPWKPSLRTQALPAAPNSLGRAPELEQDVASLQETEPAVEPE